MSEKQNDSSMDAIYVAGFLLLLFVLITWLFGEQIVRFHLWMREFWVDVPGFFLDGKFEKIRFVLDARSPRELMGVEGLISQVSYDLRWIMLPLPTFLFGWYAYHIWKKNPAKNLKRVLTRESLVKSEVRLWPWISPVVGKDLIKESIKKGPWAMCKTPIEFSREYHLLDGKEINKIRSEKLFSSQLGALWEGPQKLPRHIKSLLACFLAHANNDKKSAMEGLATLAVSVSKDKPDYGFSDALLAKHIDSPIAKNILNKHAYVVTILMASLEAARQNGVVPPNYFLWLRPRNRSLWYALNTAGRRTPFCEVAGIYGHYLAEKVAGHKIERPYTIEAVKALERAIREFKFD